MSLRTFYIKNMVCDRCKNSVSKLIMQQHALVKSVELGRIQLDTTPLFNLTQFTRALEENGFELIQDPDLQLVETIKVQLLHLLNTPEQAKNFTTYLAVELHKDYSVMSKLFKKIEGQTIEKYVIKLKIEKVKELIQLQQLSFSEIAYQLGYNSISHLSSQFKTVTGLTMSAYKDSRDWNRLEYDKIL